MSHNENSYPPNCPKCGRVLSSECPSCVALREEVERLKATVAMFADEKYATHYYEAMDELKRLREAVEWACSTEAYHYFGDGIRHVDFKRELRRKAKEDR